ncbi:N-acyl homoserine lactonase family protein [Tahibacter soli]|uniref:N-acyl homoserine lactonase family protein n=1 Tax=Tahibacter soli TaxID=2983605 RepID=A0A9X3YPH1_9GAMM|nr:N-acyl homoserine lactonase family protein [Tahibacter soli]MDC8014553.1 N-acyl homoserine lactonase family protein [Tahibacter soli]
MIANTLRGAVAAAVLFTGASLAHAAAKPDVRLYALDCGTVQFKDFGIFADTGEYDGKPATLAASCFVVKHPNGILVWDTGLGDKLADKPAESPSGIRLSISKTMADQLAEIKISPADVNFIAFSHFHFDHLGNAGLFGAATWLVNSKETHWAEQTPPPFGVDPSTLAAYKTAKTKPVDGDYDVFGDGSVKILKTPGHTPGHQVLMLTLAKSGTVILAGDLWHTRENRAQRRLPSFNDSRADTLASMDRVEAIAKRTKARVVIQHDPADFKALPAFPAYLD